MGVAWSILLFSLTKSIVAHVDGHGPAIDIYPRFGAVVNLRRDAGISNGDLHSPT